MIFVDLILIDDYLFESLSKLPFNPPKLIFVSSNTAYSLKAFKFNAVDFILKPIEFSTLLISIYKSIKLIEMERIFQMQKISTSNSVNQNIDYIAIPFLDKIELIKMQDIVYCQADGKYTNFHLSNGKKMMSSRNLGEYSAMLDSNYFFRIHHSYIINLRHISKISKKEGYFCELPNNTVIPVAKRRQDDFNKFIKLKD